MDFRSVDTVHQTILEDIKSLNLDVSVGSIVWMRSRAIAASIWDASSRLSFAKLEDMSGVDLDNVGEQAGLIRGIGARAQGQIKLAGVDSTSSTSKLKVGTILLANEGWEYQVVGALPLKPSTNDIITIEAKKEGMQQNLVIGDTLKFKSPILPILTKQTVYKSISGGADAEDDVYYRARLIEARDAVRSIASAKNFHKYLTEKLCDDGRIVVYGPLYPGKIIASIYEDPYEGTVIPNSRTIAGTGVDSDVIDERDAALLEYQKKANVIVPQNIEMAVHTTYNKFVQTQVLCDDRNQFAYPTSTFTTRVKLACPTIVSTTDQDYPGEIVLNLTFPSADYTTSQLPQDDQKFLLSNQFGITMELEVDYVSDGEVGYTNLKCKRIADQTTAARLIMQELGSVHPSWLVISPLFHNWKGAKRVISDYITGLGPGALLINGKTVQAYPQRKCDIDQDLNLAFSKNIGILPKLCYYKVSDGSSIDYVVSSGGTKTTNYCTQDTSSTGYKAYSNIFCPGAVQFFKAV
jgi:hypothetical protein